MPEPVRFAVVGCGSAALPVCAALAASPLARLVQVYDQDLVLASDLAQRYAVDCAEQLEQVLVNPAVDAVYIAVPHNRLAPLARLALEADKAALVEKPLALTLTEADDLITLAEARRRPLGVFYELRHHAAFAQARELVQAGAIGRLLAVRLQTLIDKPLSYWQAGYTGRSRSPWRGRRAEAGGGVVLMNASHLLDAVWYLTGLEVERVSAEAATLLAPVEVEDTAAAAFRYAGGALGSLIAGAHVPGARLGDERFDLIGSEGQFRLPDPYGADPFHVYLHRPWGDWPAHTWTAVAAPPAPIFAAAVEAFARAVQQGAPAPTSGRDARRVLAIVLALYQSAAEGRAITLQEPVTHEPS